MIGGVISASQRSMVNMTGCKMENNRAVVGAAALFFSDGSKFRGDKLTIKNNFAPQASTFRFAAHSSFTINDAVIEDNQAFSSQSIG
jgi:hypothetical protein